MFRAAAGQARKVRGHGNFLSRCTVVEAKLFWLLAAVNGNSITATLVPCMSVQKVKTSGNAWTYRPAIIGTL